MTKKNALLYKEGKKFQKTGVFSKKAKEEEDKYILKNIATWYTNWKAYLKKYKKKDDLLNFDTWISLEISRWELKYGFVIKYELLKKLKKI